MQTSAWQRNRSWMSDTGRRIRNRVVDRYPERFRPVELRQLASLQSTFGAGGPGADVLVFGDSAMIWTMRTDADRLQVGSLIKQALPSELSFEVLAGPGYNARIVSAYLYALSKLPQRPRVVLVPTSVLSSVYPFFSHPSFAYDVEAAHLREMVDAGVVGKELRRPDDAAFDAYDRLPCPSLIGARRTVGEIRLITDSRPTTSFQKAVRTRCLYDYYNADALTASSPGIAMVSELGRQVAALGLPTLAYIAPVNLDLVKITLGAEAPDHVRRNAGVIETAYLEGAGDRGRVLNAIGACAAPDFNDPVHLGSSGRHVLAEQIAHDLESMLGATHD